MRNRPTLTSSDTHKMMAACKAEAGKKGWNVSIAIVDDAGMLLMFERMDGASPMTGELAVAKAQCSAALRMPSKAAQDLVKDMPGALKLKVVPLQGAVPILHQGDCLGAIGISGAASQDDEDLAKLGIATLS